MDFWFLLPDLVAQRNEAMARPEFLEVLARRAMDPEAALAPVYSREGRVAAVRIEGVLSPRRDILSEIFGLGGTTYPEIQDAIRRAEIDPEVSAIRLDIDSPGGSVSGSFETAKVIASASKPVTARVGGQAASAAYLLASQAKRIEASGPASMVGSIGVAAGSHIDPQWVDITSTDAPDKRPDLSTEAGRQVIREQLDELHGLLVKAIAAGRGVTAEVVNRDFGRGRMMTAAPALERKMIDAASQNGDQIGAKIDGGERKMDLQELKTQHPDLFAAAVAEGVAQEKARVASHLSLASRPGCQAIALKAIADGTAMSADLAAQYAEAAVAAAITAAREDDEPKPVEPAPAADPAKPETPEGSDTANQVAALVAEHFGLEA
jgi:ClpP class serine protease